jgi:hypothetical protein
LGPGKNEIGNVNANINSNSATSIHQPQSR